MITLGIYSHYNGSVTRVAPAPIKAEHALAIFTSMFAKIYDAATTQQKPWFEVSGYVHLVEHDSIVVGQQGEGFVFSDDTASLIRAALSNVDTNALYRRMFAICHFTYVSADEPRPHGYPDNVFSHLRVRARTIQQRHKMTPMTDAEKAILYGESI